jgi:hypothetical protein
MAFVLARYAIERPAPAWRSAIMVTSLAPIAFVGLVVTSWALRPLTRRDFVLN